MPTQVQSRSPSTDPLHSPRVGVDKYPPQGQHDPIHHPSCDPRAKFNLQHREALRTALGSILAPKRPSSISGSRSSSGSTTPAYSFSGSSGTYTPATPPVPYTPSLDASNSQEHPLSRFHLPPPHYHPTHPPSKLGRVETHTPASEANASPPSLPTSNTPPQYHSPVIPPHPLFRSRSHNPSNPPSSRTSPRVQPQLLTPPLTPTTPAMAMTDTTDLGPPLSPPPPPVVASNDGRKINAAGDQMPRLSIPAPTITVTQAPATVTNRTGSPSQTPSEQHPGGSGSGSGSGTPRAKFIQTLQGKSAWDALIHGSFS